ncbi:hypothetical protein K402DRAFT_100826 [Aulographum hederae CBS 113979]|uniref:C3H1-type domain-containing protein n=1 Tax=Aulographum hederae CBS 113979 TaxID=1176131 RepID=A0A6G1GXV7_9PEZI|nr:hypothetical protein K402DRAFT_100826 [Aulographum hederae CBS 113979]
MTAAFSPQQPPLSPSTAHHPHFSNLSKDTPPFAHHPDYTLSMNSSSPPNAFSGGAANFNMPHRNSQDFNTPRPMHGANGNGPLPVPAGPHNRANGHPPNMRPGVGPFGGARSPPNNKNTSHVPCKFFRQGMCQAGKACPFLHTTEPVTPCKYYQKGNCKFGMKCANEHIMPDGRRANRGGFGLPPPHLSGRVNHLPEVSTNSLLTMQSAHLTQQPQSPSQAQYGPPDDYLFSQQLSSSPTTKPQFDIPTIDTTFTSHPGSTWGSPPNDGRLPISPVQKGLSVMDAPLPASFDSQGISHMARYGPIAASVPSRFGLESSSPPSRTAGESATLRNLHSSAFGDDRSKSTLASSPPSSTDEVIGRKIMHSERYSRPKMMSSSLGNRPVLGAPEEWDPNFQWEEEDLVPHSLHELLTPQEKMRRFSRTGDEQPISGLGTPVDTQSSKIGSGSPSTASPSRFGALFYRQQQKADGDGGSSLPGLSAFGHVGSPLRNSSLHPGASPSLRAVSRPTNATPGDISPFVSSPPRQSSMSIISQQLQRTRLSSRSVAEPDSPAPVHPGINRVASGGSNSGSATGRLGIDRAVSSSSVGREMILEEELEGEGEGLFSMDEVGGNGSKRNSGIGGWTGWGSPSTKTQMSLGAIGRQPSGADTGAKENIWATSAGG